MSTRPVQLRFAPRVNRVAAFVLGLSGLAGAAPLHAEPAPIIITEHGRMSIERFGGFTMAATVRPAPDEFPCPDTAEGYIAVDSVLGVSPAELRAGCAEMVPIPLESHE